MELDQKEVAYVAGAGAVGGGGSIVYSLTIGVPPVIDAFPWGVPAYLLLGAIAAIFGVFLVARTDTRHATHCLAFAMACGLFWAPIFDATSALIQKNKERKVTAQVTDKLENVKTAINELTNASEKDIPKATASVVQVLNDLAITAPEVRDRHLTAAVSFGFKDALGAIEMIGRKNPKLAESAIKEVYAAEIMAGLYGPPMAFRQPDRDSIKKHPYDRLIPKKDVAKDKK